MKNKPFDLTLTIRLTGISTNSYRPKLLIDMFSNFVAVINSQYSQTNAAIEVTDNIGGKHED